MSLLLQDSTTRPVLQTGTAHAKLERTLRGRGTFGLLSKWKTTEVAWKRFRVPSAISLISAYTVHLLWYPFYGEHFARLGDQHAAHLLRQWYTWNRVFVALLILGPATLYSLLREDEEHSRLMPSVFSATVALGIVLSEVALFFLCVYLWYAVRRLIHHP